jgi:hypothetical protein
MNNKYFTSIFFFPFLFTLPLNAEQKASPRKQANQHPLLQQKPKNSSKQKESDTSSQQNPEPSKNHFIVSNKESENSKKSKKQTSGVKHTHFRTSSSEEQVISYQEEKPPSSSQKSSGHSFLRCANAGHSHSISLRHREGKGIGYNEGYSSLDLFFSQTTSSGLTGFMDLRGHLSNQMHYAANAGLGIREVANSLKLVFGLNAFYDFRRTRHTSFHQLGAGMEILGKKWDFRVNGYGPFVKTKHILADKVFFSNQRFVFLKKYEFAMAGSDASFSRIILKKKYIDLLGTAGGYYFTGHFKKQAIGGLLRFVAHFTPYLSAEVQGSYDSLFKAIGQVQLALSFPFGRRLTQLKENGCPKGKFALEERFIEPASRFEMIVTDKHKKKGLATNR